MQRGEGEKKKVMREMEREREKKRNWKKEEKREKNWTKREKEKEGVTWVEKEKEREMIFDSQSAFISERNKHHESQDDVHLICCL